MTKIVLCLEEPEVIQKPTQENLNREIYIGLLPECNKYLAHLKKEILKIYSEAYILKTYFPDFKDDKYQMYLDYFLHFGKNGIHSGISESSLLCMSIDPRWVTPEILRNNAMKGKEKEDFEKFTAFITGRISPADFQAIVEGTATLESTRIKKKMRNGNEGTWLEGFNQLINDLNNNPYLNITTRELVNKYNIVKTMCNVLNNAVEEKKDALTPSERIARVEKIYNKNRRTLECGRDGLAVTFLKAIVRFLSLFSIPFRSHGAKFIQDKMEPRMRELSPSVRLFSSTPRSQNQEQPCSPSISPNSLTESKESTPSSTASTVTHSPSPTGGDT